MTENIPIEPTPNPEPMVVEEPRIENPSSESDTASAMASCSDSDEPMIPHATATSTSPSIDANPKPPPPKDQTEIYKPPVWAQPCPSDLTYQLEVIKSGVPLPDCTVNLGASESDSISYSFCLFGRTPDTYYAPSNTLLGQCITLAHPSISRLHAVLQFGRPPLSIAKTSASQPELPGWYLQDLGSTHGTFVNKRRLPPGRFVRIHVGYVIRFGGSSRLHILQGPDQDTERESAQSWSELKKAKQEKLNRQLEEPREPGTTPPHSTQNVDLGCDWGISLEDQTQESKPMSLFMDSAACLSHEKLYRDDPKRALNAYFEREGIDPVPQYEFVEAAFGKQHCRIELPLASGTVTAEAIVSGKRKEATVACALEACQLLDRLGEFDPDKDRHNAAIRIRTQAYWEENDYYSSDEDTFIDRTGLVEQKRLTRIRQLGIQGPVAEEAQRRAEQAAARDKQLAKDGLAQNSATMLAILSQLEKVGEEIVTIEERLAEIDREFAPSNSNPSELDELEAYMSALKANSETRQERSKLKSKLFRLRQTEMKLFHQAKLPQLRYRASRTSGQSDAANAVRAAKHKLNAANLDDLVTSEQMSKSSRATRDAIKRSLANLHQPKTKDSSHRHKVEEAFVVEEDDDEEEREEVEANSRIESKLVEQLDNNSIGEEKLEEKLPKSKAHSNNPVPHGNDDDGSAKSPVETVQRLKSKQRPVCSSGDRPPNADSPVSIADSRSEVHCIEKPRHLPSNEPLQMDHDSENSVGLADSEQEKSGEPPYVSDLPPQNQQPSNKAATKADVYAGEDPDYVVWVPPANQEGDGITALNAKYGY